MKPTEGRQWAHILCASWHQEVQFTNTSTYKAVESIILIPDDKWTAVSHDPTPPSSILTSDQACLLCGQQDGAVTQCTDCELLFHPSCAWTVGYRFGFEFVLVSSIHLKCMIFG